MPWAIGGAIAPTPVRAATIVATRCSGRARRRRAAPPCAAAIALDSPTRLLPPPPRPPAATPISPHAPRPAAPPRRPARAAAPCPRRERLPALPSPPARLAARLRPSPARPRSSPAMAFPGRPRCSSHAPASLAVGLLASRRVAGRRRLGGTSGVRRGASAVDVAVRGQAMTVASVASVPEGQRHVGPSHPSQHVAPHTPRRSAVGWVRPTLLPSAAAMASGQHIYDLTLLLDPAVEAERREQIVADIADLIDRTGEFIGRHDWAPVRPPLRCARRPKRTTTSFSFEARTSCLSSSTTI